MLQTGSREPMNSSPQMMTGHRAAPAIQLQRADILPLEQAVILFQVSPAFRKQFSCNCVQAIVAASLDGDIGQLTQYSRQLILQHPHIGIEELAQLLDNLWPLLSRCSQAG